jgi:hypothetical protein
MANTWSLTPALAHGFLNLPWPEASGSKTSQAV